MGVNGAFSASGKRAARARRTLQRGRRSDVWRTRAAGEETAAAGAGNIGGKENENGQVLLQKSEGPLQKNKVFLQLDDHSGDADAGASSLRMFQERAPFEEIERRKTDARRSF